MKLLFLVALFAASYGRSVSRHGASPAATSDGLGSPCDLSCGLSNGKVLQDFKVGSVQSYQYNNKVVVGDKVASDDDVHVLFKKTSDCAFSLKDDSGVEMQFKFNSGKIEDVCSVSSDSEERKNVLKSIASLIQIPDNMKANERSIQDVVGQCNVEYPSDEERVKDFSNCVLTAKVQDFFQPLETVVNDDYLLSRQVCRAKTASDIRCLETHDFVDAYKNACVGDNCYKPEENEQVADVKAQIKIEQTLSGKASKQSWRSSLDSNSRIGKLEYTPIDESRDGGNLREAVKSSCNINVRSHVDQKPAEFIKLVEVMRTQSASDLETVYQTLSGICQKSNDLDSKRTFFDALIWCGSEQCIKFSSTLIGNSDIPKNMVDQWLFSFSINPTPTSEVARHVAVAIENVRTDENIFEHGVLALGTLIYRTCEADSECMNKAGIQKAIEVLKAPIVSKCKGNTAQILATLRSIGNAGIMDLNIFKQCLNTNDVLIGAELINSLRRVDCGNNDRDEIINQILDDESKDIELRQHAYVQMWKCPTEASASKAYELYISEKSDTFKGLIWSHATFLKQSTNPLHTSARSLVSNILLTTQNDWKMDYYKSLYFSGGYWSRSQGAGVTVTKINKPGSWIPKSTEVVLDASVFGKTAHVFGAKVRTHGIENALTNVIYPVETTKNWNANEKKIRGQLGVDEPPRLSIGLSLFDHDFCYMDFSDIEGTIKNFIQQYQKFTEMSMYEKMKLILSENQKSFINLFKEEPVDFQKESLFLSHQRTFASSTGLGMQAKFHGAALFKVKSKGSIVGISFQGELQPQTSILLSSSLHIGDSSLNGNVKITADLDANMQVKYDPATGTMKLEVQKRELDLLKIEKSFYFEQAGNADRTVVANVPENNKWQTQMPILGLGFEIYTSEGKSALHPFSPFVAGIKYKPDDDTPIVLKAQYDASNGLLAAVSFQARAHQEISCKLNFIQSASRLIVSAKAADKGIELDGRIADRHFKGYIQQKGLMQSYSDKIHLEFGDASTPSERANLKYRPEITLTLGGEKYSIDMMVHVDKEKKSILQEINIHGGQMGQYYVEQKVQASYPQLSVGVYMGFDAKNSNMPPAYGTNVGFMRYNRKNNKNGYVGGYILKAEMITQGSQAFINEVRFYKNGNMQFKLETTFLPSVSRMEDIVINIETRTKRNKANQISVIVRDLMVPNPFMTYVYLIETTKKGKLVFDQSSKTDSILGTRKLRIKGNQNKNAMTFDFGFKINDSKKHMVSGYINSAFLKTSEAGTVILKLKQFTLMPEAEHEVDFHYNMNNGKVIGKIDFIHDAAPMSLSAAADFTGEINLLEIKGEYGNDFDFGLDGKFEFPDWKNFMVFINPSFTQNSNKIQFPTKIEFRSANEKLIKSELSISLTGLVNLIGTSGAAATADTVTLSTKIVEEPANTYGLSVQLLEGDIVQSTDLVSVYSAQGKIYGTPKKQGIEITVGGQSSVPTKAILTRSEIQANVVLVAKVAHAGNNFDGKVNISRNKKATDIWRFTQASSLSVSGMFKPAGMPEKIDHTFSVSCKTANNKYAIFNQFKLGPELTADLNINYDPKKYNLIANFKQSILPRQGFDQLTFTGDYQESKNIFLYTIVRKDGKAKRKYNGNVKFTDKKTSFKLKHQDKDNDFVPNDIVTTFGYDFTNGFMITLDHNHQYRAPKAQTDLAVKIGGNLKMAIFSIIHNAVNSGNKKENNYIVAKCDYASNLEAGITIKLNKEQLSMKNKLVIDYEGFIFNKESPLKLTYTSSHNQQSWDYPKKVNAVFSLTNLNSYGPKTGSLAFHFDKNDFKLEGTVGLDEEKLILLRMDKTADLWWVSPEKNSIKVSMTHKVNYDVELRGNFDEETIGFTLNMDPKSQFTAVFDNNMKDLEMFPGFTKLTAKGVLKIFQKLPYAKFTLESAAGEDALIELNSSGKSLMEFDLSLKAHQSFYMWMLFNTREIRITSDFETNGRSNFGENVNKPAKLSYTYIRQQNEQTKPEVYPAELNVVVTDYTLGIPFTANAGIKLPREIYGDFPFYEISTGYEIDVSNWKESEEGSGTLTLAVDDSAASLKMNLLKDPYRRLDIEYSQSKWNLVGDILFKDNIHIRENDFRVSKAGLSLSKLKMECDIHIIISDLKINSKPNVKLSLINNEEEVALGLTFKANTKAPEMEFKVRSQSRAGTSKLNSNAYNSALENGNSPIPQYLLGPLFVFKTLIDPFMVGAIHGMAKCAEQESSSRKYYGGDFTYINTFHDKNQRIDISNVFEYKQSTNDLSFKSDIESQCDGCTIPYLNSNMEIDYQDGNKELSFQYDADASDLFVTKSDFKLTAGVNSFEIEGSPLIHLEIEDNNVAEVLGIDDVRADIDLDARFLNDDTFKMSMNKIEIKANGPNIGLKKFKLSNGLIQLVLSKGRFQLSSNIDHNGIDELSEFGLKKRSEVNFEFQANAGNSFGFKSEFSLRGTQKNSGRLKVIQKIVFNGDFKLLPGQSFLYTGAAKLVSETNNAGFKEIIFTADKFGVQVSQFKGTVWAIINIQKDGNKFASITAEQAIYGGFKADYHIETPSGDSASLKFELKQESNIYATVHVICGGQDYEAVLDSSWSHEAGWKTIDYSWKHNIDNRMTQFGSIPDDLTGRAKLKDDYTIFSASLNEMKIGYDVDFSDSQGSVEINFPDFKTNLEMNTNVNNNNGGYSLNINDHIDSSLSINCKSHNSCEVKFATSCKDMGKTFDFEGEWTVLNSKSGINSIETDWEFDLRNDRSGNVFTIKSGFDLNINKGSAEVNWSAPFLPVANYIKANGKFKSSSDKTNVKLGINFDQLEPIQFEFQLSTPSDGAITVGTRSKLGSALSLIPKHISTQYGIPRHSFDWSASINKEWKNYVIRVTPDMKVYEIAAQIGVREGSTITLKQPNKSKYFPTQLSLHYELKEENFVMYSNALVNDVEREFNLDLDYGNPINLVIKLGPSNPITFTARFDIGANQQTNVVFTKLESRYLNFDVNQQISLKGDRYSYAITKNSQWENGPLKTFIFAADYNANTQLIMIKLKTPAMKSEETVQVKISQILDGIKQLVSKMPKSSSWRPRINEYHESNHEIYQIGFGNGNEFYDIGCDWFKDAADLKDSNDENDSIKFGVTFFFKSHKERIDIVGSELRIYDQKSVQLWLWTHDKIGEFLNIDLNQLETCVEKKIDEHALLMEELLSVFANNIDVSGENFNEYFEYVKLVSKKSMSQAKELMKHYVEITFDNIKSINPAATIQQRTFKFRDIVEGGLMQLDEILNTVQEAQVDKMVGDLVQPIRNQLKDIQSTVIESDDFNNNLRGKIAEAGGIEAIADALEEMVATQALSLQALLDVDQGFLSNFVHTQENGVLITLPIPVSAQDPKNFDIEKAIKDSKLFQSIQSSLDFDAWMDRMYASRAYLSKERSTGVPDRRTAIVVDGRHFITFDGKKISWELNSCDVLLVKDYGRTGSWIKIKNGKLKSNLKKNSGLSIKEIASGVTQIIAEGRLHGNVAGILGTISAETYDDNLGSSGLMPNGSFGREMASGCSVSEGKSCKRKSSQISFHLSKSDSKKLREPCLPVVDISPYTNMMENELCQSPPNFCPILKAYQTECATNGAYFDLTC